MFPHLAGIELANPDRNDQDLEVSILIGSDLYWTLVTGRVRRGMNEPTAVETRLGWVVSACAQFAIPSILFPPMY